MGAGSDRLRDLRNPDGGWGYYAGKTSRLEPTCWAALALSDTEETVARECLRTWPTRKGLLLERPGGTVNIAFQGLALSVLSELGIEHHESNAVLAEALQAIRGRKLGDSDANRQDNTLQGWPWVADTFSWVEPTAWSLIGLTAWARRSEAQLDATRVDEGARLLLDRVCHQGGWNYGNSNMLGAELRPHLPTSALGLLALQEWRAREPVRRTLAWLEKHALSEPSGLTLALVALALGAYGRSADDVRAALEARLPLVEEIGNVCSLAAARYALRAGARSAFAV